MSILRGVAIGANLRSRGIKQSGPFRNSESEPASPAFRNRVQPQPRIELSTPDPIMAPPCYVRHLRRSGHSRKPAAAWRSQRSARQIGSTTDPEFLFW